MSQPYIGEIRMFAGTYAPNGWAFCNGQSLPIAENDALFTLIGTTYGGDGQETFNLPDLRGRVPAHAPSRNPSQMDGVEQVTLTTQQMPVHSHPMLVTAEPGTDATPSGRVLAQAAGMRPYYEDSFTSVQLAADSATPIGGSQPHENMQPYVVVNFILSLYGIFPSET